MSEEAAQMPDRQSAERIRLHRPPKSLTDRLKAQWGILVVIGAIFAAGVAFARYASTKADAATVSDLDTRVDHVEMRVDTLDGNYKHLHDDMREMRIDIRTFAAGRPLPALTPEPKEKP